MMIRVKQKQKNLTITDESDGDISALHGEHDSGLTL